MFALVHSVGSVISQRTINRVSMAVVFYFSMANRSLQWIKYEENFGATVRSC